MSDEAMIMYAHRDNPTEQVFRQYAKDALPPWAVNPAPWVDPEQSYVVIVAVTLKATSLESAKFQVRAALCDADDDQLWDMEFDDGNSGLQEK